MQKLAAEYRDKAQEIERQSRLFETDFANLGVPFLSQSNIQKTLQLLKLGDESDATHVFFN